MFRAQVFEDHQDSIHNIAAFANKKFEAFEEFSGQVDGREVGRWINKRSPRNLSRSRSSLGFWRRRYHPTGKAANLKFVSKL